MKLSTHESLREFGYKNNIKLPRMDRVDVDTPVINLKVPQLLRHYGVLLGKRRHFKETGGWKRLLRVHRTVLLSKPKVEYLREMQSDARNAAEGLDTLVKWQNRGNRRVRRRTSELLNQLEDALPGRTMTLAEAEELVILYDKGLPLDEFENQLAKFEECDSKQTWDTILGLTNPGVTWLEFKADMVNTLSKRIGKIEALL